jgi:DNA-directed RNA polymerase subunit RPC12/RpoP
MSDHYRCLDCGHGFRAAHRWVREGAPLACPACDSPGLIRVRTFWRNLRDAFILTNAA